MYLFTSDPRMEYLLHPSPEDLTGLEENIRRLRRMLITPTATGASSSSSSHHSCTSQNQSTAADSDQNSKSSSSDGVAKSSPPDLLFQYASALVSHNRPSFLHEGIGILENLVFEHWAKERRKLEGKETGYNNQCANDDETPSCGKQQDLKTSPTDSSMPMPLRATAPRSDSVTRLDLELEKEQARIEAAQALLPVCYYYLSIGWLKLEDYDKARRAVERMLDLRPEHPQGIVLQAYIDKLQTRDGVVGIAGVALALAATAGLALAGLSKRR